MCVIKERRENAHYMDANRKKFSLESRIEIYLIQLMKNRAIHILGLRRGILFGFKIKVRLSTSNLPKKVINNLENEKQLLEIFENNELKNDDPIFPENGN